jgi:hypothetical protein
MRTQGFWEKAKVLAAVGMVAGAMSAAAQPAVNVTLQEKGGYYSQSSLTRADENSTQIPEATTWICGALLLLPFGASTLRILYKRNKTS